MYRFNIFCLNLIFFGNLFSQSDTLKIRGEYQGKNVYFQSHSVAKEAGTCIEKITINGQIPGMGNPDFEIDLSPFKFRIGDSVKICIIHKKSCQPKIMNPEVFMPVSSFEISDMSFNNSGLLTWKARKETGKLAYKIEQYVWHKWVTLAEIKEKSKGENQYSYKPRIYNGKNLFRLKQVNPTGDPRLSDTISFYSSAPIISVDNVKFVRELTFSDSALFEISDKFGTKLKKGVAKKVDCLDLKNDSYSLNIANQEAIIKIEKISKAK